MPLSLRSVLRAVLVLACPPALADSVIVGTVVDAMNKKPVSEVEITATSPNLQGERVVSTDAQGQYRIPQLVPGIYTMRFVKSAFRTFTRPELSLRMERTIRVNVELLPEGFKEEVPPPGPPTIGGMACMPIDSDFIHRLTVSRVARPVLPPEGPRGFVSVTAWAPRLETLLPLQTGVILERSLTEGACSTRDNPLSAPDRLLSSLIVTGFTALPQTVHRAPSPGCPN